MFLSAVGRLFMPLIALRFAWGGSHNWRIFITTSVFVRRFLKLRPQLTKSRSDEKATHMLIYFPEGSANAVVPLTQAKLNTPACFWRLIRAIIKKWRLVPTRQDLRTFSKYRTCNNLSILHRIYIFNKDRPAWIVNHAHRIIASPFPSLPTASCMWVNWCSRTL